MTTGIDFYCLFFQNSTIAILFYYAVDVWSVELPARECHVSMGSKMDSVERREKITERDLQKPPLVLKVHLIKKQCKSEVSVMHACPSHN